jgi:hypothetical protein
MKGRVSQLIAWAIFVVMILVPPAMMLTGFRPNLAWLAWTFVSLWVALDAVHLTMMAFPAHHSPLRSVAVTGLAVVNMVLSLAIALWPTAWISAAR